MSNDTNNMDVETVAEQYLTFELAGEEYAINILKVQEIRSFEDTTRIPSTPPYLLGVINLRGSVVPIVDLRIKFDMGSEDENDNRVVILVKVKTESRESTIGIRVDAVSDVHSISAEEISAAPEIAQNSVKHFVTGLATVDDKMIIMLDIDALITTGILEAESVIGLAEDAVDGNVENV